MTNVKGPTSALSSFLRERGIRTNVRNRYDIEIVQDLEPSNEDATATSEDQTRALDTASSDSQSQIDDQESDEEVSFTVSRQHRRQTKKSKAKVSRKRKALEESDAAIAALDSDYGVCIRCQSRFLQTLSESSKKYKSSSMSLCPSCLRLSTVEDKSGRKAGKKKSRGVKSVRNKSLYDEFNSEEILPLSDMCIKVICEYVDQVEGLGDMLVESRHKMSKIMSKHRQLDDSTVKLFLDPLITSIKLYDCANISENSFKMLCYTCPNISELELYRCGQMSNDVVDEFSKAFRNLKTLVLSGCYLVRDVNMARLIENNSSSLESLVLEHSQKLGHETLSQISRSTNLQSLRINFCSLIRGSDLASLKNLSNLEFLDLSSCALVDFSGLGTLIKEIGPSLHSLKVAGCKLLGDEFFKSATQNCRFLTHLDISNLENISSQAVCTFGKDSLNELKYLDVSRSTCLDPSAIVTLASKPNINTLIFNGITREITVEDLIQIIDSIQDLIELDVSWMSHVMNDYVMEKLFHKYTSLKKLHIWGCVHVTQFTLALWKKERPSCLIIGAPYLPDEQISLGKQKLI